MNRAIGSPLISISFRSGEKWVRLTHPTDWERAVRAGEISPDSMVVVEHGAVTEAVDAGDIQALVGALGWAPKPTPIQAAQFAPVA